MTKAIHWCINKIAFNYFTQILTVPTECIKKSTFVLPCNFLDFYTNWKLQLTNFAQNTWVRGKNHLQLINTEFMTCIRSRMLFASEAEVVGRFRWCPSIWYTCSKIGRTCSAIIGSAGFMATATSVIHANFLGVSLLISQANCWRRASRTPWLRGSGTIDKIPGRSTWWNKGRLKCQFHTTPSMIFEQSKIQSQQ